VLDRPAHPGKIQHDAMRIVAMTLLAILPATLRPLAQDGRAFEAASVKRRAFTGAVPQVSMTVTPGRIRFQAVMLKDTIRWAYGVADFQIRGPDWIGDLPRWDIEATAGTAATDDEMRAMFRRVLAERFGLRVRRDTEEARVMLLTVAAGGSPLKRAADDAPRTDDWRRSPFFQATKAGPGATRIRELRSERASMRQLTDYLSRQLRLPVLDRTGLKGDYTFTMEWPADPESVQPDGGPGPPPRPPTGQAPDLFGSAGIAALREQLGLSLAQGRATLDLLIIESVHEASEN
jgi:uncharacterized protein (TIGR03435 family)